MALTLLRSPGSRTFLWLLLAQTVSGLGSSLTAFALGVWLYQRTGQGVLLGLGQAAPVWALAGFFAGFFTPIIGGSSLAIWQSKVEPDLQGRVFAVRPVVTDALTPVALLLSGGLADRVFEPATRGDLGRALEPLLGTGSGRGYALMFVLFGLLTALFGLSGYLNPRARNVEAELPDATPGVKALTG